MTTDYPRLVELGCQQGHQHGLMLSVEIDETRSFGLINTCGGPYYVKREYPYKLLNARQKYKIQNEIAFRASRGDMKIEDAERFLDRVFSC